MKMMIKIMTHNYNLNNLLLNKLYVLSICIIYLNLNVESPACAELRMFEFLIVHTLHNGDC